MSNFECTFRLATADDLTNIHQLFVETIKTVCKEDYTSDQIKAWTSGIKNTQRWLDKIATQYFMLALADQKIVGFASLENNHYLDFLYVHKDHQGRGIAASLYEHIEKETLHRNGTALHANVSFTAKPFFEKMGFREHMLQTHIINGVEISNYSMSKVL